jgi:hypothetical protein
MPETHNPARLRDVARQVLAAANEGRELTLRLDLPSAPLTSVTVRVRVRPPAGPTPCELDILAALAEAQGPWTTTRVLSEMDRRGMLHGQSTITHALAKMSKAGLVRASRKAPRGYTLPAAGPEVAP